MDTFYPKTRRPRGLATPLKRPPAKTISPPPTTPPQKPRCRPVTPPTTPPNCRIPRPDKPPPVQRKIRRPATTVTELFKSVHPLKIEVAADKQPKETTAQPELGSPEKTHDKILTGPLKGVSTSLLDLIRAKEAQVKPTPEQLRQRELLGIAADVVRIVKTIFTANKKTVMLYDFVVEKCHKGLKSNYSTSTIIECLDLMNKVAPEWVTVVEISRGKFIRLNSDKYTLPQLMLAINKYKKEKSC